MATARQQEEFIERIAPIVQKCALANGYKVASPVIAQACLESAYGLSGLAKYHNYFGLKCGSKWSGASVNMKTKEEYKVGTLTTIRDNFRAYDSMEDGVRGYYVFISAKRYSNLRTAETPEIYLQRIKADGYATASGYVRSNMSVIERHGLFKYDTILPQGDIPPRAGNPYAAPKNLVRLNSRGNGARWLQYELNARGARLVVDGIAGPQTICTLKAFQAENGLIADGVCGPRTIEKLRQCG